LRSLPQGPRAIQAGNGNADGQCAGIRDVGDLCQIASEFTGRREGHPV